MASTDGRALRQRDERARVLSISEPVHGGCL